MARSQQVAGCVLCLPRWEKGLKTMKNRIPFIIKILIRKLYSIEHFVQINKRFTIQQTPQTRDCTKQQSSPNKTNQSKGASTRKNKGLLSAP